MHLRHLQKIGLGICLDAKPVFGLVVVNPSWVFGPKAYDFDPKRFNSSNEMIDDLLN